MSSISKQAGSENGSFYVLQNPNYSEPLYHIGGLFLEENLIKDRIGFYSSFDKSKEQSLGSVLDSFTKKEMISHLEIESSDAELRLNPTFEGKDSYRKLFEEIKKKMVSEDLQKAVLFNTSMQQGLDFPSRSDFLAYARTLISRQKMGYVFGFYNPIEKRAYLGLSPEFLCREQSGVLYTTAVAGTKGDTDSSGVWSSKLVEEHELVKRGIDQTYKVEWFQTQTLDYGRLRHLRAEGRIQTKDSVQRVSEALHPTSAVGVLPRDKTYLYRLGDLSSSERCHFGGYAYLGGVESTFSLVTIRGIEWSNDRSFVCIGGGVLPESQFEDEWLELEKKWETFKSLWRD